MSKVQLQATCTKCGEKLLISADIDNSLNDPNLRCGLKPASTIRKYVISSELIKKYLIKKAQKYVPDVKMEVVPRYIEVKKPKRFEPHKSYASFRIAFSEAIIENTGGDDSWFYKIGTDESNVRIEKSMFSAFIKKYGYNSESLNEWTKSYKTLEELEEAFGITEQYLNDIKMYAHPKRIMDQAKNRWIIFSAAAENIIKDMFTDPDTNKEAGRIEINDIRMISKDIVEFTVYLHPEENEMADVNSAVVRSILLGEEKPKK